MRAPLSKKSPAKGAAKKLALKKLTPKKGKPENDVVSTKKTGLKKATTKQPTTGGKDKKLLGTKRKLPPQVEFEENDEEDERELEDIDGLTARDLEVLNRLGDNDSDSESDNDFGDILLGGDDYEDDMEGLAEEDQEDDEGEEDELEGLEGGDDDEEGEMYEEGEGDFEGEDEDEGDEDGDMDEFDEDNTTYDLLPTDILKQLKNTPKPTKKQETVQLEAQKKSKRPREVKKFGDVLEARTPDSLLFNLMRRPKKGANNNNKLTVPASRAFTKKSKPAMNFTVKSK